MKKLTALALFAALYAPSMGNAVCGPVCAPKCAPVCTQQVCQTCVCCPAIKGFADGGNRPGGWAAWGCGY